LVPVGTALGLGLGGGSRPASAQAPIQRASGSKLKTSLNAYSFNQALSDHLAGRGKGMTLFELLDFCAEHNLDAIDPTGYYFPGYPRVPADAYLNDFKRRAFVRGLDISGTGVRNNFAAPDRAKRAADVQHVKEWIEVAARLGAPVIRVFAGPEPAGHSWEQAAEWLVEALKQCVEHGRRYGVLVGIQNHGDMLKSADQVLQVVKMVDSEWFGVVVDIGYFLTADPYQDIARVLTHAVNWQIKEQMGSKAGKVRPDLRKLVRLIREGGYRGYLPIETLPVTGEPYEPRIRVPRFLKELQEALQQQG
jgi:sugar phosphate isomerase/epimerase